MTQDELVDDATGSDVIAIAIAGSIAALSRAITEDRTGSPGLEDELQWMRDLTL